VPGSIHAVGEWIIGAGVVGTFVYGVLNRLLIPFGLHHILNSFIWFVFGEYTTPAGVVATGDLNRFFAGDPHAGMFMGGFYIMMMFGMPAVALAMYRAAKPENRLEDCGRFGIGGLYGFPDWYYGTNRVHVHVPGTGSMQFMRYLLVLPCRYLIPGYPARVWLLGWFHRLCAELGSGDEAAC
jgi:hypothetical protein